MDENESRLLHEYGVRDFSRWSDEAEPMVVPLWMRLTLAGLILLGLTAAVVLPVILLL